MGLASETGLQYGDKARSLLGRARDKQLTAEMFAMQRSNLDQTEQHSATRLAASTPSLSVPSTSTRAPRRTPVGTEATADASTATPFTLKRVALA